ncbi:spore germination protein GerPC [Cytobacillus dafuensis]|uniref:Spore gernimation protein n=1 Tax=Cytobacillus dafuensis TaxID=1742359 RepID=A0A5B8Z733_CYTDA|nr:spore germination protein GerPC [Cytobacillus dafuensis]QED47186.1 spore gernimation protein [Cytobacillus dafuensis]
MTSDLYSYLQKLHVFIDYQEKRILSLERKVSKLTEETKTLKERPAVNVDKIEYKFDQLKVETLEGTLNIGLNPSDLNNIDDFTIENKGIHTPYSPNNQMYRTIDIENAIFHYLDNELTEFITEIGKSQNIDIGEPQISFIKEDIKKQLPSRIDFYLKKYQSPEHENNADRTNNLNDEIINQLKMEIQKGVQTFLNHLPDNVKGLKNE